MKNQGEQKLNQVWIESRLKTNETARQDFIRKNSMGDKSEPVKVKVEEIQHGRKDI